MEAGLLPTEAVALLELGAMLELLNPQPEPILLMGDFNACTASLAPSVKGQISCMSTDTVFNARSCAFLSLLTQHELATAQWHYLALSLCYLHRWV